MHTAQAGEAPAFHVSFSRLGSVTRVIYFIHGPDRLLARQSARSIAGKVDPDGLSTSWLDGRQTTIDQIVADIGTRSFFSAPRVVIVTDLFGAVSAGQQSPPATEAPAGRRGRVGFDLDRLFGSVPEDHHLVLLEADLSGPPAVLKSTTVPIEIVASEPPRGAALIAWIEAAAHRAGAELESGAARQLAQALFPQTWERTPKNARFDSPPDLALLEQEIAKLAVAAHPGRITPSLVTSLIVAGADARLFRFVEAAFSGDLHVATPELARLQAAGEEPAAVLAQLFGQLEISAVVSAAGAGDAASVAKDLGTVTPGRVSAAATAARRQPHAAARAVVAGAEIDRALKSGRIRRPAEAIHTLMLALASRETESSPRS